MAKERTASPLGSIKNLKVLPESGPVEALVKLLATRCLTFTAQTAAAARGAARTLGERREGKSQVSSADAFFFFYHIAARPVRGSVSELHQTNGTPCWGGKKKWSLF